MPTVHSVYFFQWLILTLKDPIFTLPVQCIQNNPYQNVSGLLKIPGLLIRVVGDDTIMCKCLSNKPRP